MMKTMAQEAGPFGVRVLSVAPGAVATPINAAVLGDKTWQEDLMNKVPLKRIGQPEDIASVALFLASGRANNMQLPVGKLIAEIYANAAGKGLGERDFFVLVKEAGENRG